jgi:hypothetical protein
MQQKSVVVHNLQGYMFKKALFYAGLILVSGSATAQVRKYSNEFLSIGVGARALSMSNAQVSTVGDATSGYWNPAGLLGIRSNIQLALMHSEYFAGIAKFDYGSIAAPIDNTSAIGATFIRFGVDDIPDTTDLLDADGNVNYDRIKSFSAADYAFLFSYARRNSNIEGLRYGANAKIIYRNVGEFAKAWGFGLDAGAQYDYNKWSFGVMAKDVTSTFNAWSFNVDKLRDVFQRTGNELPESSLELTLPKLIAGATYRHSFSEKISTLASCDLDFTFDGKRNVLVKSSFASIDPHIGLELGYSGIVFLRGGLGNIQTLKGFDGKSYKTFQPNIGAGIRLKRLEIDYALTNIGSVADGVPYSNVISLKLDIYKSN